MPEIIHSLKKDKEVKPVYLDFIGLIRTLLNRFTPKKNYEVKFNLIEELLKVKFNVLFLFIK